MPSALPDKQQPDALSKRAPIAEPSIILYLILVGVIIGLVAVAFHLAEKPDWPNLLLNVAAGLISALIVLIFVDRRLRENELSSISQAPEKVTRSIGLLFQPNARLSRRYCEAVLGTLDPLVEGKFERESLIELDPKIFKGFVLLAGAGYGKTTWMQMTCAKHARGLLNHHQVFKAPILFPLRRWLPDRDLEEALYEHVTTFATCSQSRFRKWLRAGSVILLLDGYDELVGRRDSMSSEIAAFRNTYADLPMTISSRPHIPISDEFGEVVIMTPPTDAEIEEIRRKIGI